MRPFPEEISELNKDIVRRDKEARALEENFTSLSIAHACIENQLAEVNAACAELRAFGQAKTLYNKIAMKDCGVSRQRVLFTVKYTESLEKWAQNPAEIGLNKQNFLLCYGGLVRAYSVTFLKGHLIPRLGTIVELLQVTRTQKQEHAYSLHLHPVNVAELIIILK